MRTVELRDDWAARKSKALGVRRLELERGAPPKTGTGLADAIARYYEDHPHLRPRTIEIYKRVSNKLTALGEKHGVTSADDLTGPKLVAFRASLVRSRSASVWKASGARRQQRSKRDRPRQSTQSSAALARCSDICAALDCFQS